MSNHLCIKWGSPLTISYIRMSKYVINWVSLLYHFYENLPQKFYFTNVTIYGAKTNPKTCHFIFVFLL